MTASRPLRSSRTATHQQRGRMIELAGEAIYDFRFHAPVPLVFQYFADIPLVLRLMPDILSVEAYAPSRYRMIVGASDGHGHAMSAIFDLAAYQRSEQVIWLEPDSEGPPIDLPGLVFHGALRAEASFKPAAQGAEVCYSVELAMNIPIPGVLRLMPQHLLQGLGERAMEYKMTQMIDGLAHGIHRDFHHWANG